jgi:hypothetical protein
MKLLVPAVAVVLLVTPTVYGRQAARFDLAIPFAEQATIRRQNNNCPGFTNGSLYPTGTRYYAGVRFEHGPDLQYAFMGGNYCGGPPRALEVAMAAPGTVTVHVLLNAWYGCSSGPDFIATVTFADGSDVSWTLRHGIDYRDHNGSCPLAGPRSQQVWSSGYGQRLDLLTLPIGRSGSTTTGFRIESTQPASPAAAPFVFGITVSDSTDCDGDGVADFGQCLDGTRPDVDGNLIPDTCDCPADINQSGTIDAEDLAYVLFAWGMTGGKAGGADINGDATVDANDLSMVLGSWGPCPD